MQKLSLSYFIGILLLSSLLINPLPAHNVYSSDKVDFSQFNLGGPRLGVTVAPNGDLREELEDQNMGPILSQFGWHFEYQVVPEGGGPAFVIQMVPMVAGVEYGKLVPHGTLAMGIRLPSGIEFGIGPNLLYTGDSLYTALVMGIGKTFNYGGVNIPLNIAFATNPSGYMASFVFGYSIIQGKKK